MAARCVRVRRASARAVHAVDAALRAAVGARQRGGSGEPEWILACRGKAARTPARRCLQGADTRWLAAVMLMPPASGPAVVPAVHGRA